MALCNGDSKVSLCLGSLPPFGGVSETGGDRQRFSARGSGIRRVAARPARLPDIGGASLTLPV